MAVRPFTASSLGGIRVASSVYNDASDDASLALNAVSSSAAMFPSASPRALMARSRESYFGQGAPAATHCWNLATNSAWGIDTGSRPRPGFQPQSTSLSWLTCSRSASRSLPPLVFVVLIVRQRSPLESPMKTIFVSGGGRCQFGAPGGTLDP